MNKKSLIAIVAFTFSHGMSAQSVYPGQHQGKLKKETVALLQVKSFDLKDIRLLHSFRTNAGVAAGCEGGYMTVKKLGRWESLDCEWRGHTTGHHTFDPGCSSDKEHFFDPKQFSKHISGYTGETCCTYNMLMLSRHLFCWNANPAIADYYERALYNHILGQQDPATGMVTYFLPLLSGSHKVYSTKENSFWCCVGSGFENHAKYGEAIYYHNDHGLYVNLFIPSQVVWKEKGLVLRQETEFPKEETTRFTVRVTNPVVTTVYLRYPSWSQQVEVRVNGRNMKVKQKAGSYIAITREWRNEDHITAT